MVISHGLLGFTATTQHAGCDKEFHPSCALQRKAALADPELLAGEVWDAEVRTRV